MALGDEIHLWQLVIVYLTLLGIYLILLGVAVAGLMTALNKRNNEHGPADTESAGLTLNRH